MTKKVISIWHLEATIFAAQKVVSKMRPCGKLLIKIPNSTNSTKYSGTAEPLTDGVNYPGTLTYLMPLKLAGLITIKLICFRCQLI